MSFLLSRNPLVAGLRVAVGLGLLAYGLLGLGAVGSWSAGGLSPAGYQALPECAGDPVPTDGTCYSVLAGTVRSTRQQLTRDFVTITDARATRVVELASGDRFATFRPATVVAVKYLGSTVTAVGVPVPGGTQALTSTVDSPLVHRAVLGRRLRYIAAGLVGLLLGGLPLLFGRRQRWGRRPASAHGVGAPTRGATGDGPPAVYSAPAAPVVSAPSAAAPSPVPAPSFAPPTGPSLPAAAPALPNGPSPPAEIAPPAHQFAVLEFVPAAAMATPPLPEFTVLGDDIAPAALPATVPAPGHPSPGPTAGVSDSAGGPGWGVRQSAGTRSRRAG